jgi:NitT/TauT family transport system ATP-binding protein
MLLMADVTVCQRSEVSTSSAISVERLSKRFDRAAAGMLALHEVNCTVRAGEFVALVGESGCGKTTLLRLIAGLDTPTTGRVLLGNQVVQGPTRQVGFVFQRPVLLAWRTVLDNVLLPVELARQSRPEARQRAFQLLTLLGLRDFAGHRPHQLSGGMQQRAALARTLILHPSVLLMDEPFSALDAITREQLNLELLNMWHHGEQTVVFITHDITEAVFLADRVLLMSQRPGTIAHAFPVPLPRPRTLEMRFERRFTDLCHAIHQAMGLLQQGASQAVLFPRPRGEGFITGRGAPGHD